MRKLLCLSKIVSPRVLTLWRRDFPCVFILTGWLAGSVGTELFGIWALIACLPLLLSRQSLTRVIIISYCAAGSSVLLTNPRAVAIDSAPHSYLIEVKETPRFRKVGATEFLAQVQARVHGKELEPAKASFNVLCSTPHLPWRNSASIEEGARFIALAELRGLPEGGSFSYAGYLRRRGIQALCRIRALSAPVQNHRMPIHRLRDRLRTKVERLVGDGEQSGLVLSMAFGFRDVVSEMTETAFKRTGLAHLLVLSGAQVTIVYLSLLGILKLSAFTLRKWGLFQIGPIEILTLLSTGFFVLLTGLDPPSIRAFLALSCWVVASLLEQGRGVTNFLCVSLLFLSALTPGAILDPSVQLTFAALLGLALGFSPGEKPWKKFLLGCAYASLATSAVSLVRFGTFSLLGFFLNLTAAPLISLVGVQGVYLSLALEMVGLDSKGTMLQMVAQSLNWFCEVLMVLAEPPWVSFEIFGMMKVVLGATLCIPLILALRKRAQFYIYGHGLLTGIP